MGSKQAEQRVEPLNSEQYWSKYYLHYNFPPFSVGEVGRYSGTGRREIGHGKLAERAIQPILPDLEDFPYTIRLVSDILESNGSSSMATVCACCLALMDAGAPIKRPVAGVAMGLIKEGEKVAVLTDILGLEDHLGDMDFKVTGTREGVTAFQMDTKIGGISREIFTEALGDARNARLHILGEMAKCLSEPRSEMSKFAPKIDTIQIPVKNIGQLIGPGGKVIKKIQEETGATIEVDDTGMVFVSSIDQASGAAAMEWIRGMMAEPEVGATYKGTRGLDRGLRRLRRVPARQGRPAAHLRAGVVPRRRRVRRAPGRRRGGRQAGGGRQPHRQGPPEPQGAAREARGFRGAAARAAWRR